MLMGYEHQEASYSGSPVFATFNTTRALLYHQDGLDFISGRHVVVSLVSPADPSGCQAVRLSASVNCQNTTP